MEPCTIVVCTYNRLKYLKKCTKFLLELNYPEYEIIRHNLYTELKKWMVETNDSILEIMDLRKLDYIFK